MGAPGTPPAGPPAPRGAASWAEGGPGSFSAPSFWEGREKTLSAPGAWAGADGMPLRGPLSAVWLSHAPDRSAALAHGSRHGFLAGDPQASALQCGSRSGSPEADVAADCFPERGGRSSPASFSALRDAGLWLPDNSLASEQAAEGHGHIFPGVVCSSRPGSVSSSLSPVFLFFQSSPVSLSPSSFLSLPSSCPFFLFHGSCFPLCDSGELRDGSRPAC